MISIVYDAKLYHKALASTVKPGDTVIEIGPHIGESTKVIAGIAKKVIAVDKATQAEKAFKANKFPNVTFIKGDVRFYETITKVSKLTDSCDVLAMDMGGGRFPDTVFKTWCVWSGIFKPRDSIIRNYGLGEFMARAKVMDPSLDINPPDSGWLSQSSRKNPAELKEGLDELKNWIIDIKPKDIKPKDTKPKDTKHTNPKKRQ